MKKLLLLLIIPFLSFGQQTYVPDDNFEQALIDLGYDDVLDNYVLTNNINVIYDLMLNNLEINDLTGIEDFVSLGGGPFGGGLWCQNNNLSELDISNLTQLTTLNCSNNNLVELNVSNNNLLVDLYCSNNLLTELNLSSQESLIHLFIDGNQINCLDIGHMPCPWGLAEANLENPNLFCIQVNDVDCWYGDNEEGGLDYSWMLNSSFQYFSEDCDCETSPIAGCTDPNASNYNSQATVDDDSCEYECNIEFSIIIEEDCLPNENLLYVENVTGGSGEYTYSWQSNGGNQYSNEAIASTPLNGNHTVTITDLNNEDCFTTQTFSLNSNVTIHVDRTYSCPDDCNGSITFVPTSGPINDTWVVYYASNDLDNDGIPDVFFSQFDPDIDGDGIDNFGPDGIEGNEDDDPDIDGDGILNEDEPPVKDAVYHDYTILYPSPNSEPQEGNFNGGVNIPDYIFEAENLCPIFMTGFSYHMVAIGYSSEVEMNGGDFCWSWKGNFGFGPDEDNCPETSIGCSEEGESYPIGFQLEISGSDCA
jgi:hypothetical protein